ncbi:MAG: hypothetical protein LKM36_08625 [Flavobacteriales bacterium]|jgi:hypothetical protein|nr:hypothetical protein [Flavobacteriales bacterium]MCI1752911.1 hypothetical protein [Flavobacteriales bacterium]
METNEFESLGRIGMVDPPPFLLTRIEARIASVRAEKMPVTWAVGMVLTLLLLVTVNTVAYQKQASAGGHSTSDAQQLATDLSLSPSEQLYR